MAAYTGSETRFLEPPTYAHLCSPAQTLTYLHPTGLDIFSAALGWIPLYLYQ
jgi:hypothetical protein